METPEIVKNDPYLEPFKADFIRWKEKLKIKRPKYWMGNRLRTLLPGIFTLAFSVRIPDGSSANGPPMQLKSI